MQWLLTILLGLLIAWAILAFVGPKCTVSYYTQAPVEPVSLSDLDKLMAAVGLKPSGRPEPSSVADIAIMQVSAPESVADVAKVPPVDATNSVSPQSSVHADPGMQTTPQPAAPAPSPAHPF
jgi:hypothetical protein